MLKKGGTLHILEFAKVQNKTFSKIYDFYSYELIPRIGNLVSSDKESYENLVTSIRTPESQEETCEMLKSNGFSSAGASTIPKAFFLIRPNNKPYIIRHYNS